MPINPVIVVQPVVDQLLAAYRPMILRVAATRTDGDPIPPVVYCDIYIRGIFYKTISKTHYTLLNAGVDTEWEFDIQDAVQEYLEKYIANNGQQATVEVGEVAANIYCKFRSSGYDANGFIQYEDVAPIQGTEGIIPVPGTGITSNPFYGVNATLQHEDNQDLEAHLDTLKYRTWDVDSYPLTHRPDHYKICTSDSDSFPIITKKEPKKLKLWYLPVGSTVWQSIEEFIPCIDVIVNAITNFAPAVVGVNYDYTWNLLGTPPFTLDNVVKPAWMNIAIVDSTVRFTGIPLAGDVGLDFPIQLDILNCTTRVIHFSKTIDVLAAPSCVAVDFDPAVPALPDGTGNTAYNYNFNLTGDGPFALSVASKPSWMTITLAGSNVAFTGTPALTDISNNVLVDITISNCSGSHDKRFYDLFDVVGPGKAIYVINDTGNPIVISNSLGYFTIPSPGGATAYFANPTFTIFTMVGMHNIDALSALPATIVQSFIGKVQGDLINLTTDFANSNYLWFRA